MTNKEFQHLLDMAISRGNLNEVGHDKVYVMLTWWDDVFLPLTTLDGSWRTGEKICVFGSREDACNKWHNGLPCAFWIAKDAVRIEQATHRPLTLKTLYHMTGDNEEAPRKFLISNSPRNVFVDINPFKTRIIRNWEGETMLCFYADDRDSGEMVPFERMTEKNIMVIDEHRGPGKYEYGTWTEFEQDDTPVDIGAVACERDPGSDKAADRPLTKMENKKISCENITTVGQLIDVLKTMPANATICGSKFNDHDEYDCEVRPFSVKRYFNDMDDNEGVVYVGVDYKHPN